MSVLAKIQKELKVGKENRNEFGKYNYRSCSDILEAVKPLLPTGWAVMLTDDMVLIGERYYVKATASLIAESGIPAHASTAFARESFDKKGMDDSQITGAASSYARKYALNGLFAIDDTTDADGMDNSSHKTKKEPVISDDQAVYLGDLITETKTDAKKFLAFYKIASLSELQASKFDHAEKALKAKVS
jgi:hypothetical protein